jgi:hypothetical protein
MSELKKEEGVLTPVTQGLPGEIRPRNIQHILEESVAMMRIRPEAVKCFTYAIPQGKDFIQGPSVRIAEFIASQWGNLHIEVSVTQRENNTVMAEATAWDIEKNIKVSIPCYKSITSRDGRVFTADLISKTKSAAVSVAYRNAVFKVIPKFYVDTLLDEAHKILEESLQEQRLPEQRIKIMSALEARGVTKQQVLEYFEIKSCDELSAYQLKTLIGIGTSLKDGILTPETAFIPRQEVARAQALLEKIA